MSVAARASFSAHISGSHSALSLESKPMFGLANATPTDRASATIHPDLLPQGRERTAQVGKGQQCTIGAPRKQKRHHRSRTIYSSPHRLFALLKSIAQPRSPEREAYGFSVGSVNATISRDQFDWRSRKRSSFAGYVDQMLLQGEASLEAGQRGGEEGR